MPNNKVKRILIVGDSGRGKSTLALKISKKLKIQSYSTDDFYYEVKFSRIRGKEESVEQILKIFKNEEWIVEGTTHHLVEHGLASANKIINLQYNSIFAQWIFLLKRHQKRDNETVGGLFELMKHVLYKKYSLGNRRGKPTTPQLIAPYKYKTITLSSFGEIDNYLDNL